MRGIKLHIIHASSVEELDAAFATIVTLAQAGVVGD